MEKQFRSIRSKAFEKQKTKALKKENRLERVIEEAISLIESDPERYGGRLRGRTLKGLRSCDAKSYRILYSFCKECNKLGEQEYNNCHKCNEISGENVIIIQQLMPRERDYKKVRRRFR